MLDHEIDEFGRRLGLPGLELNQEGRAALAVDGTGVLSLELGLEGSDAEGDLLMALALDPVDGEGAGGLKLLRALERFDWRNALPYAASAGLVRGHLILTVRFAQEDATAAKLENAFRWFLDEASRF